MRTVFVDAAYYIAMLNPQDDLHDRAIAVSRSLGDCIFFTTEMILTEVLNFFAERGAPPRQLAANFVQQIQQDPARESSPKLVPSLKTPWNSTAADTTRSGVTPIALLFALWSRKILLKH